MKKYHQLILIITSVISVALLLIYRHEYNRLRYVLEVLNFFGKPADCTFPDILNSTNSLQHDWGPAPVWTKDEDISIYSAFLKNENDVEALVVHDGNQSIIKSCYLWCEDNTKAVIGKIKYSKIKQINDNNALALYKYNCHTDSLSQVPYAVSFTNKNKKTYDLKKIMLNPLSKTKLQLTTICVIPSTTYRKQQIIEFISYHKMVGVDTFIIYHNNIPYTFMNILRNLGIKLGIEIINYPWNYPYYTTSSSKIRNIIEEDCVLRTKNKSRNVMILDWSELIVPRYHHTISAMFDSYDPLNRTHRFRLNTLKFCLEKNDRREPAILHSIYYDNSKPKEMLYVHRTNSNESNVINTQDVSISVAAVHQYLTCTIHSAHRKTESVMLKFSNDMKKSTLFKLFKYNRL